MLYYLKKLEKSPKRWGSAPKPPLSTGGWGPPKLLLYFWALLRFLGIVNITAYYLILERRLGPFSQACKSSFSQACKKTVISYLNFP